MNWLLFIDRVPVLIDSAMKVVEKLSSASGPDKKAAVIESVPDAISLTEFAAGKEVISQQSVLDAMSAYIDAQKAAMKMKASLQAAILAAGQPVPPATPPVAGA